MKTYLINAVDFRKDRSKELSAFGVVERVSYIFNIYKLITELDIKDIKKIDFVVSVKEEEIYTLDSNINE